MKSVSDQCYRGDFKFAAAGKIDAVAKRHCNMYGQHSGVDDPTWVTEERDCFDESRGFVELDKFPQSKKSQTYIRKED